jgi:acetyltransferase-like isoleucine patch superfamily enzyme
MVDSFLGFGSVIAAAELIEIEDHCEIAEFVVVRDQDHRYGTGNSLRDSGLVTSPIHIGPNVWIGAKATILRGVSIGDSAVIGANAVVTKNIDAGAVVVGIPARPIRDLPKPPAEKVINLGSH